MASASSLRVAFGRSARSVVDEIGDTPLLQLRRIPTDCKGIEIHAKAEFMNPGGSVKDRPGLNMILDGERRGALRPGLTILDASSGNTAIAYAMIGSARGYRVRICIPENASAERKRTLLAYGAELELTDPSVGSDGAILRCREIYAAEPDKYFYPDQYSNPANWQAHYNGTAPEIMRQTGGRVTHFVAIMGTSGTFTGVSRRLKQELPRVQCISVQPSSGFHGIEGTKNMEAALVVPKIYDSKLADRNILLDTEEAFRMTRRLAREEGILAGVSSGANVAAAMVVARELAAENRPGVIVTVLCDSGVKYLSEEFWTSSD